MIDIYRFVNSKSVAEHLRSIGHEFTASQAAYLVHKCDGATLVERVDAWRAIVAEMPDERLFVEEREFTYNVRELIEKHIANKETELRKFLNEDGAVYFPYESRWSERPRWVNDSWFVKDGLWNTLTMPVPFSALDKCKDYLRNEGDILENGWRLETLHEDIAEHVGQGKPIEGFRSKPVKGLHYDRHVVCRVEMDKGWYCSYGNVNDPEPQSMPLDYVVLDGGLEIMDVAWGWKDITFDYMVPAIPIPFKRGDVVIDRTARVSRPFVFAFAVPWARGDDGFVHVDVERLRVLLRGERKSSSRLSDMNFTQSYGWRVKAFGYEVDSGSGLLSFGTYGACGNYLNLEYYDGPLDGELRPLAIASELLKGDLGFGEASNFNRCAALGNHLKAMLR